jgi:hypothetical protein
MSNDTSPIKTRWQAYALAGALTLTVLTGAGALFGLAHKPSAHAAAPAPAVVQAATPAPTPYYEGGDN